MTTLLLCPINTGDHWEIAFAFPQSKKIVYINSLGEQRSKIAKFIRGWRCLIYKRSMEGLDCGKGHGK
jgi:Ulp1 family protease